MPLEFLHKWKKYFVTTATVICIIAVIISGIYRYEPTLVEDGLSFVIVPVQGAFSAAFSWVSEKINFVRNTSTVNAENEQLKEEVSRLRLENERLKLVADDYEKLRELIKIDEKFPDYEKVGARVIGKDPSNWYNMFLINKGSDDGLQKNMVVLGADGVVGRIFEAGRGYSKVIPLIDDQSSVSVISTRTGDTGVLKGDMVLMKEGLCRMDYIELSAEIMAGDELVTSHLSDIYPPGLTIGYVTSVATDSRGFTKEATVRPYVDFKHLEEVFVIAQVFEKTVEADTNTNTISTSGE